MISVPSPEEIAAAQRAKGLRKYGGDLRTNGVPLAETIQHAREEAADLVTYLTHAAEMAAALPGVNMIDQMKETIESLRARIAELEADVMTRDAQLRRMANERTAAEKRAELEALGQAVEDPV